MNFAGTNSDIAFLCHPLGDLGVTYTVHLWLVEKRLIDFLLVLIERFRQLSRLRCYMSGYWSKLWCSNGGGSLLAQISSTNDSWCQRTRVPGCCLRYRTFSRFDTIPACDRESDRHTDRQTNTRRRLIPTHRLRREGENEINSRVNIFDVRSQPPIRRKKTLIW